MRKFVFFIFSLIFTRPHQIRPFLCLKELHTEPSTYLCPKMSLFLLWIQDCRVRSEVAYSDIRISSHIWSDQFAIAAKQSSVFAHPSSRVSRVHLFNTMSNYDGDDARRDAQLLGSATASQRHIPREHTQAQQVVCACCFRKPAKKTLRRITTGTDSIQEKMKEFVLADIDEHQWQWLPEVICSKCRNNLKTWKEKKAIGER